MDPFEAVKTIGALGGPIIAGISLGWQIKKHRDEAGAKARLVSRVPRDELEISYTAQGPIIVIPICYRAEKRPAFVERVEVTMTHSTTKATFTLAGSLLLEYERDPSNGLTARLVVREPFFPFGVHPDTFENKILFFHDAKSAAQVMAVKNQLAPRLNQLFQEHPTGIPDEVVDEYNSSVEVVDTWNKIRDEMYLRPGLYQVEVRSFYKDGDDRVEFSIEISRDQFEVLRGNAYSIVALPRLGQPAWPVSSIFCRRQSEGSLVDPG